MFAHDCFDGRRDKIDISFDEFTHIVPDGFGGVGDLELEFTLHRHGENAFPLTVFDLAVSFFDIVFKLLWLWVSSSINEVIDKRENAGGRWWDYFLRFVSGARRVIIDQLDDLVNVGDEFYFFRLFG